MIIEGPDGKDRNTHRGLDAVARLKAALINADVGFDPELTGYAASLAAVDLLDHWATCHPPLTHATKLSDIDGVIAVLQRWRRACADQRPGALPELSAGDEARPQPEATELLAAPGAPMAKYRVMTEQAKYTPYFKVFEAPTLEAAERQAEAEVEAMTLRQTLPGLGWTEGDSSTEYTVKLDTTEALKEGGAQ